MASFEPNINPSNSDTSRESNQKKRRKIGDHAADHNSPNLIPWRSETEQRIYSCRLVEALRRTPSLATKPRAAAGQVRETADRVLAATARGRTRWSRSILNRCKKFQRQHKKVKKASTGLKRTETRRRRLPAVQRKARALSRLVPGCRKVSFPNLLEETTDYIFALEMQVRAMTALAELLAPPVTR
ncbi:hypothetical protein RJT34_23047 [Clitoria ternatea]|uniref:BHLH domain-containing protein n=1 Tax=Clitoria ternatea TaxID=43366 RepID=A0AAN9FNC9_CLITE